VSLGYTFRETMRGHFRLNGETRPRALSFTIVARTRSVGLFGARSICDIEGAVEAEGLTPGAVAKGTLEIDPLLGRRLVYTFSFEADDGRTYRFEGQKSVSFLRLAHSMTTLPAKLYDARGDAVGEALVRFDLRSDFLRWLRTWRVAHV